MTRFTQRLDELTATVKLMSDYRHEMLSAAIRSTAGKKVVAIGSGGSLITAQYFRRCRQTLFAEETYVATAAEFVLGHQNLEDTEVWLFSAGADNPDSIACVAAARDQKARKLFLMTRNPEGAAALDARDLPLEVFIVPVADQKDGFLATHSLISSVTALLVASDAASLAPGGQAVLRRLQQELAMALSDEARNFWRDQFSSLRRHDVIILVCDPQLAAVAEALETSLWEASLVPVQRTDVRNFAHGRHSWLHHRTETTFLFGLFGHDSGEMWETLSGLVPAGTRRASMDLKDCGRMMNACGIIQSFAIVEAIGLVTGIDPGKPGIGKFGRELYSSEGLGAASKRLGPATRQKRAAILEHDDEDAATHSCFAMDKNWLESLGSIRIGALVLDYDGTLISDEERFGVPRAEIIEELLRLSDVGMGISFATGRGGSVGTALREAFPEHLHARICIGYYNGAYMQPLSVDIDSNPPAIDAALADAFAWMKSRPELFKQGSTGRFSKVQISVGLDEIANIVEFQSALQECPAIAKGLVKHALSGHSIDFTPRATSKNDVVRLVEASVPEGAAVVCVGDSGRLGGNDNDMLSQPYGVSVGSVCGKMTGCRSLFGNALQGPEALLKLLRSIRLDSENNLMISRARLALDNSKSVVQKGNK